MLVLIYYSNHWNEPLVYNKFTLACRFWSSLFTQEIYAKEETFGISSPSTLKDQEARQESRHTMNMTPNDPRTKASTCKSSRTQPENGEAWIEMIQALTVKEMMSKAHIQVHTNKESHEKQPGRKPRLNRAETGLGRPAWADRPSPLWAWFVAPFALGVCLFIASSSICRYIEQIILSTPFTRKLPPQDEGESWMSSSQRPMPAEGRKQEDSKPLA
jgi:hypothetical protein